MPIAAQVGDMAHGPLVYHPVASFLIRFEIYFQYFHSQMDIFWTQQLKEVSIV